MPATSEVRARLAAAATALLVLLGAPPASAQAPAAEWPDSRSWLEHVNVHRRLVGLPPVTANPDWERGNDLHGRYIVENDLLGHDEDPARPWFTPEGRAAARASNLTAGFLYRGFRGAIDGWLAAPFHGVGIIDPALAASGYGEYWDPGNRGWRFGAGLDVIRGRDRQVADGDFPVFFPGDGSTVPLYAYSGSEFPEPLTSCPGYRNPVGLPLIAQLGRGDRAPDVRAVTVTRDGREVAACHFDETSYRNPDPDAQATGQAVLGSRDAVVVIPREPLVPGAAYTVTLTDGAVPVRWSFTAFDPAVPILGPLDPRLGMVDPAAGRWYLGRADGPPRSFFFGNPGDVPIVGDWDCDGVDTPGMYRQADGFVYLRDSNDQGVADRRFFFGNPGDVPLAGDFDGDGCDTVSIYRPATGQVFVIDELGADGGGLGAADRSYLFGNPGDKPFVGDFDGDGVDTVGLHRESTGLVYFRQTHTQGIADAEFVFGDPGDRLVAADFGPPDGVDTPALFRPRLLSMYLRFSNTAGNADAEQFFGRAGWVPVAGDFGG